MKTIPHTIYMPNGQRLDATICVYGAKEPTQPQHDDLYRPDGGVWAVAEIHHEAFKNRAWTVSTDTPTEAKRQLRAEVVSKARETLGFTPVNPYVQALLSLR